MNRDFLFGVIAVQLGQATAKQVMAAASAYFTDDSQTIPERLRAQGSITEDNFKMIEKVVATMLKANDGDAAKTMNSLGGDKALYASFGGSLVLDDQGKVSQGQNVQSSDDIDDEFSLIITETSGRYRFEENAEIGRGGIGRVLVAFDEGLGREIAVKELLVDSHSPQMSTPMTDRMSQNSAISARFLREARVTGQLEHPNIIPVYEVGQRQTGEYYYTMKLVRGRTLADALKTCSSMPERLKLLHHFVDLCNAVAYAHSRGVVHRDIKPENVMLGEFGETVVLDWGLAKVEGKKDIQGRDIEREMSLFQDAATGKTVDGTAIGTPAYMSPEQADGAISDIDHKSDIWSLGAVLYELLTGKPPFDGITPYEIIGKVMTEEVVFPLEKQDEIPAELKAVTLKALSRPKADRYDRAELLAEEINAFMSGGRIEAYEYSAFELLKSFVSRHKAVSFLIGLVLFVVAVSSMFLFGANQKAQLERDKAQEQKIIAINQRGKAEQQRSDASANLAQAHVVSAKKFIDDKNYGPAYVYATAALREYQRSGKKVKGAKRAALESVLYMSTVMRPLDLQRTLPGPGADIASSCLSPDGKMLVLSDRKYQLWLYVLDGSKKPIHVGVRYYPSAMKFTSDSKSLLSVNYDGTLRTHDVNTLKQTEPPKRLIKGAILQARFSPDSKRLLINGTDGMAILLTRGSSTPPIVLGQVTDFAFSHDGKYIARTSKKEDIVIHDGHTGEKLRVIDVQTDRVVGMVSFSCGDKRLLVNTDSGRRLVDLASGKVIRQLENKNYTCINAECFKDGWILGTDTGFIYVDGQVNSAISLWKGHGIAFVFVGAGGKVASVQPDGVRVWKSRSKEHARVIAVGSLPYRIAFSADGKKGVLTSLGGYVYQLDMLPTPRLRLLVKYKHHVVVGATISADGKAIATVNRKHVVSLFDTESSLRIQSERLSLIKWPQLEMYTPIEFTPDYKHLLVANPTGNVYVLNASTLKLVRTLTTASYYPTVLKQSSDKKFMMMGDWVGSIFAWDAKTLRLSHRKGSDAGIITDLITTRDGKVVITAGRDGWIRRYSMKTQHWGHLSAFEAHDAMINTMALSPDENRLVTSSDDYSHKIWNYKNGELLRTIHSVSQASATYFSKNGEMMVLGYGSSVLLLPNLPSMLGVDGAHLYKKATESTGLYLKGFALEVAGKQRQTKKPSVVKARTIGQRQWRVTAINVGNSAILSTGQATIEVVNMDGKSFSPRLQSTTDKNGEVLFDLPEGVETFHTVIDVQGVRSYNQSTFRPGTNDSVAHLSRKKIMADAKRVGVQLKEGTGVIYGKILWEESADYSTSVPVGCATITVDDKTRVFYGTPSLKGPGFPSSSLESSYPSISFFYIFGLTPGVHELTIRTGDSVIKKKVRVYKDSTTFARLIYDHKRFLKNPTPMRCMQNWVPTAK
jgi:eukaryotic-like serine/threonine-protein kinase